MYLFLTNKNKFNIQGNLQLQQGNHAYPNIKTCLFYIFLMLVTLFCTWFDQSWQQFLSNGFYVLVNCIERNFWLLIFLSNYLSLKLKFVCLSLHSYSYYIFWCKTCFNNVTCINMLPVVWYIWLIRDIKPWTSL